MKVDPRFLAASGRDVFGGNELLVKGCLETPGGVHLYTGYPGSPVATFFDCLGYIGNLLKKNGIRAMQANNEALGAAALNGSQMLPTKAVCTMKSVGLHVAADALALGNLAGPHPDGGALVITGDDPWCDSTQVPADSRFLCEHLRMPIIEPGSAQEMKDWVAKAFEISQRARVYIGYIVTTTLADGGGTVACRPNHFPAINMLAQVDLDTANVDLEKVLLPPRTVFRELEMPSRHATAVQVARELGVNQIIPAKPHPHNSQGRAPIGFITTGMARIYLEQVLADVGLSNRFPILNMGMPYPCDVELVKQFGEQCETMIVIEERRSFLEKLIRDGLFKEFSPEVASSLARRLYGKRFPDFKNQGGTDASDTLPGIPEGRGLNPSVLAQLIYPLLQACEQIDAHERNGNISQAMDLIRETGRRKLELAVNATLSAAAASAAPEAASRTLDLDEAGPLNKRLATFCPGCPHRDSSAALLELRKNLADPKYMQQWHKRGPVDLVAHGDTGCYTMLMFTPTEQLMHNYSGMGLGGGTGSGIDPFIKNKQIVFMGDGTFFHSGAVAISNAIKARQDICFIILENGTTAMTGHQEHPGTEIDVLGNETPLQDIYNIVKSLKSTDPFTVVKMTPANREKYYKKLESLILKEGVKVMIADKECGITYHRRENRKESATIKKVGFLPKKTHMNVTHEVCEHCLQCTKQTACPGLSIIDTDYGKKVDTDLTWCVNDGACERVKASNEYGTHVKPCPSFEQVTIIRKHRKRYLLPKMDLAKLPEPARVHDMEEAGNTWRVHMSGVGGMGIGVVSSILVRAGHKEGYDVSFCDKKGLAIRNGGVYSQITYAKPGEDSQDSVGAGLIPFGKADLLIGIDVLEAARAVDPRADFRVASKARTSAVLNTHKQVTTPILVGREDFETDAMRDRIFAVCEPEHSFARNLSELCESRLGSKQFVNIMMLGVAYQLGLIPVSQHAIAWSIRDTVKRGHRQNMKAFNIGRKLALEPRVLPNRPEPRTWQQLLTQKAKIVRKTLRNGDLWAKKLEQLTEIAIGQMPSLPEQAKYDMALRIYDLLQYENAAFAKRYVDLVRTVYRRDSADQKYAATTAVIFNLAKVMLIKDEPYVAYLLTRYEKKVRDMQKFGVDEANGDKIVYRHHTSPEFPIGPYRLRLKITTTDWMLDIMRRMKILRKLPGWHRREVDFREWYIKLLDRVQLDTQPAYEQAVQILRLAEDVKGYREIRYPTMDTARAMADGLLGDKPKLDVTINPAVKSSSAVNV
ncbi:MAG: indolepyruvate ferredoxin oxidoreductase [Phycisphaerales bacterium]|nr:indolepyruvate ferredoxin oxidoreductase [Phycisphaerales bacterium]